MDRNKKTSSSWSWSDIAVGVGMVGAAVGATYGLYKLTETESVYPESRRQALPQSDSELRFPNPIVQPKKRVVSMDCEMIQGKNAVNANSYNILGRVSIIDYDLKVIYDEFVKPKPTEELIDCMTWISGITEEDIENGKDFVEVQNEVLAILKRNILVGHSLKNDLRVLGIDVPEYKIRDTQLYPPFQRGYRNYNPGPKLKDLARDYLNENIQQYAHDSIEDATAAMKLYKKVENDWENDDY